MSEDVMGTPTHDLNRSKNDVSSAMEILNQSLQALANTKSMTIGGLVGYGLYVVGVLTVLFFVANLVSDTISALAPQLVIVTGMLLAAGLIGTAVASYVNFRRAALVAELEIQAFNSRAEIAKQRGSLVVSLLEQWSKADYQGFTRSMEGGGLTNLLRTLDQNYAEYGVANSSLFTILGESRVEASKSK